MAQLLQEFPTKEYPWDEWLDGEPRTLYRGDDFETTTNAMRVTVYRAGARRGLRVRTILTDSTLTIQARRDED